MGYDATNYVPKFVSKNKLYKFIELLGFVHYGNTFHFYEKKKINILMQISLKKYAELRRPFGWNFIKMMNINTYMVYGWMLIKMIMDGFVTLELRYIAQNMI